MHYKFEREDWYELIERGLRRYEAELEAERAVMARFRDDIGILADLYNGKGNHRHHEGFKPVKEWLAARAGRPWTDLWALALASRKLEF